MSTLKLTPTQIRQGVWEGMVEQTGTGIPQIKVTHLGTAIEDVAIDQTTSECQWLVKVPIPINAISQGVQVFVISDATDDETLGQFTLIAGEVLGDDIRSEVELLRAELDMLKRAFRRHCIETS